MTDAIEPYRKRDGCLACNSPLAVVPGGAVKGELFRCPCCRRLLRWDAPGMTEMVATLQPMLESKGGGDG